VTQTLLDIGQHLYTPIAVERVDFLPQRPAPVKKSENDGPWECQVFPFGSVWSYIDVLNRIAPGDWSVSDEQCLLIERRLVVLLKLTICGISMMGVGEEPLAGAKVLANDKNEGRKAWSQAFRRACAYFGLGLPFYFMGRPDKAPYLREADCIALDEQGKLELARRQYARAAALFARLSAEVGLFASDITGVHEELGKPFPVSWLNLLAHTPQEGRCQAFPFAKVWYYVRRLNALCYGAWQVPRATITATKEKVLVALELSIFDHPMVGIGEELFTKASRSGTTREIESAVENAWAEALKGAANCFGLGLYLRFLPEIQVGYNEQYRYIENERGELVKLYRAQGLPLGEGESAERKGA
jgi:hypothetical protein